jgi:hypothetical protein
MLKNKRKDTYKGTSFEFTVCGVRTLFRPHPQPLSHCVGEGRRAQCFWSAEAPASAWAEASLPHSIIPLSRLRERGKKGVRATQRACPFTPARGKSPLPQRLCAEPLYPYQLIKGGEGRGEGGFEADAFTNFGNAVGIIPIARAEFTIAPLLKVPPASRGEPRGARGFGSPCKQGEP